MKQIDFVCPSVFLQKSSPLISTYWMSFSVETLNNRDVFTVVIPGKKKDRVKIIEVKD
jgi:hypothetical protein